MWRPLGLGILKCITVSNFDFQTNDDDHFCAYPRHCFRTEAFFFVRLSSLNVGNNLHHNGVSSILPLPLSATSPHLTPTLLAVPLKHRTFDGCGLVDDDVAYFPACFENFGKVAVGQL